MTATMESIVPRAWRERGVKDIPTDVREMVSGKLDWRSFVAGYRRHVNHVDVVVSEAVRDKNGDVMYDESGQTIRRVKKHIRASNVRTNTGADWQARGMGGDAVVGYTGTSSAVAATSITDNGTPSGWTTNQWAGHIVATGAVYGVIVSNTTGLNAVCTIDKWYTPGTPGGAAASNPATGTYVILPGQAPAWWMALSTTATPTNFTDDATMANEITTAGTGGHTLTRSLATFTHTAASGHNSTNQTSTFSMAYTFTYDGSNPAGPVTVTRIGLLTSATTNGILAFETNLNASATVSASLDQVAVTWTVTY